MKAVHVAIGAAVVVGISWIFIRRPRQPQPPVGDLFDPQGRPLLPVGTVVTIKPGTMGSSSQVETRSGRWVIATAKRVPGLVGNTSQPGGSWQEAPLSIETNPSGGFYHLHSVTANSRDAGIFTPVAHVYGSEILQVLPERVIPDSWTGAS